MPALLLVAIPAIVVAMLYLMFLYANAQFRNGMVQLFSRLPGFLVAIITAIADGAGELFSWAWDWAKVAVYPLVQAIWVPVQAVLAFAGQVVGTLENMASLVVTLPGRIAAVTAWATAELTSIIGQLATTASRIAALAASVPGTARAIALALVDAAATELRDAIAAARAALAAAISAVALTAANELGQLRAWVTAQLLGVTTALAAAVATLGHVTGIELPDIRGQLARLGELVGALIAANLIGRLATLETTVTTTIEECVAPTCNVITPQLGVLQALMDIGLVLAVGGLVAEAVNDPEGAAKATAGVVGDVVGLAGDLGQAFAGIRL